MIKDNFAFIANYYWRESIKNLNLHLSESELASFSSNDYYYLTTIYYLGKPNFSQVAEALGLTKPAISVLIRKLVKIGLIEKVQSEEDKRIFYVCVTEKGKKIVDGDEELYMKFDTLVKTLSNEEQYALIDVLLKEIVHRLKTAECLYDADSEGNAYEKKI